MRKSVITLAVVLALILSLMAPVMAATSGEPTLPPMPTPTPYEYFFMASENASVSEGEYSFYRFTSNRGVRSEPVSINNDIVTYPVDHKNLFPPVGSRLVTIVTAVTSHQNYYFQFLRIQIGGQEAVVSPTYNRVGDFAWNSIYVDVQSGGLSYKSSRYTSSPYGDGGLLWMEFYVHPQMELPKTATGN